jgi:hypothetical protein
MDERVALGGIVLDGTSIHQLLIMRRQNAYGCGVTQT